MNSKKLIPIALTLVAGSLACSLVIGHTNFTLFATDFAPYTCPLGEGETELRELIRYGSDGETYSSRGTVTSVSASGEGHIRYYVQRTNGDDGTKTAMVLTECLDNVADNADIEVGNVVSFTGTFNTNDKTLRGCSLYKISDTNPNPVEPLVFESYTDFYNYPFNDNWYINRNRQIEVKNLKCYSAISVYPKSYSSISNRTKDASNIGPLDNSELGLQVQISGYNQDRTRAIANKFTNAYNADESFTLRGYLYKYSGNFGITVTDVSDIQIGGSPIIPGQEKTFKIYATNDFHGAIEPISGHMGLKVLGSYMKARSLEENTVLIDSGDTWQGSIYSNYNKGRLITDVMNYAHYDARTIGNHDFDWGKETIRENGLRSYEGYITPTLGANLYDFNFDTKEVGTTFQSDYVQKSTMKTLENGLKIGIVGVIGQDQITSIATSFTKDITFTDHVQAIKDEATALRAAGADIVIASVHADQNDCTGEGLGDYIDICLNAHTHQVEHYTEGKLFYGQYGRNGENLGEITVAYDTKLKAISSINSEVRTATYVTTNTTIDPVVEDIVDTYNSECSAEADVVIANNVYGKFDQNTEYPNMVAKAMYETAKSEGYNVYMSICNQTRTSLTDSSLTYGGLYNACPFDNTVYIMDLTGKEIRDMPSWCNTYLGVDSETNIVLGQTYKCAVLDYLGEHANSSRNYDYFPDAATKPHSSKLNNNYRVLTRSWLIANGYNEGRLLNSQDFNPDYNSSFSRSQLTYSTVGNSTGTDTFDYNTFVVGSYSTTVTKDYGDIQFIHTEIIDKSSFQEFGLGGNGYMQITVPSGHTIVEAEVKIYRTYDNFDFYTSSVMLDEEKLTEVGDNSSGDYIYTISSINSRVLYIQNKNFTTSVYYIKLTIA